MTTRERISTLSDNGMEAHVIAALLGLDVTDVALTFADPTHTPTDPTAGSPADLRVASILPTWIASGGVPEYVFVTDTQIVWAEIDTGRIKEADLAGESPIVIAEAGSEAGASGVVLLGDDLYWASTEGKHIGRKLSGQEAEPEWLLIAGKPQGLAADGTYLYWADYPGKAIGRVRLDGSEAQGQWLKLATAEGPESVVVNATHIFWGTDDLGIARANIDGSGQEETFVDPEEGAVNGLALDATHLYWASPRSYIARANLDGSGKDKGWLNPIQGTAFGLAVNDRFIYWANGRDKSVSRALLF